MTQTYILPLNDPHATLEVAGGKGASLARLAQAGLPVPGGFHVTTAAYRHFVAENGLQPAILAALATADAARPEALETAARCIADLFAGAPVPADVAAAVTAAYAALPGQEPAVAVRSSATAEDLPELSFAGQQETFLNVCGPAAVQEAVRRCWASLWTARAIAYRVQHGIDQEAISLAVVVQLLVPAEAAGVLFTADPLSGSREQAMITATWGLGEALVGGLVTPDTVVVDKASGRVLRRETADKTVMTVRTASGTQEAPAPEPLRRTAVLDDRQAAALARLGVQVEALFGLPVDIEWALHDGGLALLQARPITALPAVERAELASPPPAEWPRPNPRATYFRGSLAEHLPNPVSPLFATLGLRLANAVSADLFREMIGGDAAAMDYQYRAINGYVYLGMVTSLKVYLVIAKTSIGVLRSMLRTGRQNWLAACRALAAAVARWEDQPVAGLASSALIVGVNEVLGASMRYYTVIQATTIPTASMSEAIFTGVYKMLRRKGDPEAAALLVGSDTVALRAEKSLFDLASRAITQPALRDHLRRSPAKKLAAELQDAGAPANVSGDEWAGWTSRFRKHLEDFGRAAYEFDFMNPTPAEAPETLLDAVKMYMEGKGSDPYARQSAVVARREEIRRAVLARFSLFPRRWFRRLLSFAQEAGPLREESIALMGLGYPVLRRMLGELGRRFAEAGAIAVHDDVYWLTEDEVKELAAQLERNEQLPDWRERIPPRKATWRGQLQAAAPAVLPEGSRWGKMTPWARKNDGGRTLTGLGVSGGRVTAPACVLLDPEEFGKMRPGDVLVAVTTSPAWTPLFVMASAVVTDIGGPTSHSSIVAREYGIPAVMATGIATRRIRSGDVIRVDGDAGTVTLPQAGR